jgi:hypothetical protein
MLTYEPQKRISAEEALKETWITNINEKIEEPEMTGLEKKNIFKRLKSFRVL